MNDFERAVTQIGLASDAPASPEEARAKALARLPAAERIAHLKTEMDACLNEKPVPPVPS